MRTVMGTLDGCATVFGLCDKCDRECQTHHMFATADGGSVCINCK